MKLTKLISRLFLLLSVVASLSSCDKEYLEKKPDKALLVPRTIDDFQALMDNTSIMNQTPFLVIHSADEMYTTDAGLAVLSVSEQNAYVWASEIFAGAPAIDWNGPYQQVFYANIVLEGLEKLPAGADPLAINRIKGMAYFFRAMSFHNLLQLFARQYTKATAKTDLAVPMPIASDVNQRYDRVNLEIAYAQVIADLEAAENLLPEETGVKSRPDKNAARALLARVYLSMTDYDQAGKYAQQCLSSNDALLNYNTLNINATSTLKPFPKPLPNGNPEVIFCSFVRNSTRLFTRPLTIIDSVLFASYSTNDLRKSLFFVNKANKLHNFKGMYTGTGDLFSGLSNDELYLILAECHVRDNKITEAMTLLNKLLITRYASGKFSPLTAANANQALSLILLERQKQLIFRGTRWSDLRRLNLEERTQITLKRVLGANTFVLPPGDNKYVFPIPDAEVTLTGIPQNMR